jgi:hypothetical protein
MAATKAIGETLIGTDKPSAKAAVVNFVQPLWFVRQPPRIAGLVA